MFTIRVPTQIVVVGTVVDLDILMTMFFRQAPTFTATTRTSRVHRNFCQLLTSRQLVDLEFNELSWDIVSIDCKIRNLRRYQRVKLTLALRTFIFSMLLCLESNFLCFFELFSPYPLGESYTGSWLDEDMTTSWVFTCFWPIFLKVCVFSLGEKLFVYEKQLLGSCRASDLLLCFNVQFWTCRETFYERHFQIWCDR